MSLDATWRPPHFWVPVLLYHRVVPVPPRHDPFGNFVSVKDFEGHLLWLRRAGFHSVPLSVLEMLFTERQQSPMPPRPVAITFDDGYQDNYQHAWPALKRHGFAATIFVVTDAIGKANTFDAGVYPADRMLSPDQMLEMSQDGIMFGSHTCSHPESLTDLSEPELERELAGSRSALEKVLKAPVTQFSYPHSRHDPRVEGAAARAGYQLACAGTGRRFSRFSVTRIPVHGGAVALALAIGAGWARSRRPTR